LNGCIFHCLNSGLRVSIAFRRYSIVDSYYWIFESFTNVLTWVKIGSWKHPSFVHEICPHISDSTDFCEPIDLALEASVSWKTNYVIVYLNIIKKDELFTRFLFLIYRNALLWNFLVFKKVINGFNLRSLLKTKKF